MKLPKIPYWPVLVSPYIAYGLGLLLNAIVVAANHHQMPVLVTDCTEALQRWHENDDVIHGCLASTSRLKVLSDWFFINNIGTASPGDFFLWVGQTIADYTNYIWALLVIKDYNND